MDGGVRVFHGKCVSFTFQGPSANALVTTLRTSLWFSFLLRPYHYRHLLVSIGATNGRGAGFSVRTRRFGPRVVFVVLMGRGSHHLQLVFQVRFRSNLYSGTMALLSCAGVYAIYSLKGLFFTGMRPGYALAFNRQVGSKYPILSHRRPLVRLFSPRVGSVKVHGFFHGTVLERVSHGFILRVSSSQDSRQPTILPSCPNGRDLAPRTTVLFTES